MDDLALLRLERDALWMADDRGRLLHCRTPAAEPTPLLVVGGCEDGVTWATSADVPVPVATAIGAALTDETAADIVGWAPRMADHLVELLGEVAPLAPVHGGPSYVVTGPGRPTIVELRTHDDADADAVMARVPEADRDLAPPWVVALVDGCVASVCETARSTPHAVEAGVWTYEPFRRRGLAVAVTSAWAALVTERTAFYSTSWDNRASQAVARRLGLQPVGHWWQVSRA